MSVSLLARSRATVRSRGAALLVPLVVLLMSAGLLGATPPASAAEGVGVISGRVTDAGGKGLEGIWVHVYDGTEWTFGWTDANGDYAVGDLADGTYTVQFVDQEDALQGEFYDDAQDQADATPVILTDGAGGAGVDAQLAPYVPSPPVLVDGPSLSCTCGGGYLNDNPGYLRFVQNRLELILDAVPQDPGNAYRLASVPALPAGDVEVYHAGDSLFLSLPTALLASGTTYDFVVQEMSGSTVVSSSEPIPYSAQRTAAPTGFEVRDAAGQPVDVVRSGAEGHLIAGATYTIHWTGSWAEGADFWNALNAVQATGEMTRIEGGTGTQAWSEFTVPASMAGKNALLEFAATLPGHLPSLLSTARVPVIIPGGQAPLNLTAATATGTPKVGQTLTAQGGTSTAKPARTFQWKRNGKSIANATRSTYKLVSADAGSKVTVTVTGAKADYATSSVTSAARAVAAYNYRLPAVTGTMLVGRRLTAAKGSWIAPSHSFGYQWLRNGKAIRGGTRSTYTLTRSDRGTRISLRVTARRAGFPTVTATSPGRVAK